MRLHRTRPTPLLLVAAICVVIAAFAARAQAASQAQITVYAAASLTDVFPRIDSGPKYAFGGSNTLAAQIQQGAPADVFASANMTLPSQLYAKGLCSKPVVLTRNTLVIVVPKANPAGIKSVYDLAKPGIKLDVAGPGVPVGSYTLQILKNMNLTASVTKNVVSQETDVREVLSKVALGEADAGFVYSTDAKTVPGRVTVIKVPAWAQPKVQYGMCIVSSSGNKA
jgi:molybdate transport system substrate-binding protein